MIFQCSASLGGRKSGNKKWKSMFEIRLAVNNEIILINYTMKRL
jgi:hypothetical protein